MFDTQLNSPELSKKFVFDILCSATRVLLLPSLFKTFLEIRAQYFKPSVLTHLGDATDCYFSQFAEDFKYTLDFCLNRPWSSLFPAVLDHFNERWLTYYMVLGYKKLLPLNRFSLHVPCSFA